MDSRGSRVAYIRVTFSIQVDGECMEDVCTCVLLRSTDKSEIPFLSVVGAM